MLINLAGGSFCSYWGDILHVHEIRFETTNPKPLYAHQTETCTWIIYDKPHVHMSPRLNHWLADVMMALTVITLLPLFWCQSCHTNNTGSLISSRSCPKFAHCDELINFPYSSNWKWYNDSKTRAGQAWELIISPWMSHFLEVILIK